ncbi:hypothetical protein [Methylacidimicrobium tartarophylax]|uniref:Uncharacterized protein n=1 Tax=Methylacidimicrobium tartarophylax TaxID=1041768 RepID=A0A5E6MEI0_9BACT|nr:hypothetical protein [Methylacidimicrobium tartarophylax]VVM07886.1 hypothetical protein MAMT_01979 [Methylacidimicrobium tartarophylax]
MQRLKTASPHRVLSPCGAFPAAGKRTADAKRDKLLLLFAVALCSWMVASAPATARADSASIPLGSVVKEFRLPQRNTQGALDGMITGREAHAISVNRTEILDMKIELYDQGKISTTILSPRCDLWKLEDRLSTQSGAVVERPDLRLTSQIMDWEVREHRGVFRQNVRVVLYHLPLAKPSSQQSAEKSAPVLRQGASPSLKPLGSSQ